MKVDIAIKNKVVKPFEALKIQVVVENNTYNQIIIPMYFEYRSYFNGRIAEGTLAKESIEKYYSNNILEPNESASYNYRQQLELSFIENKNGFVPVDFRLDIGISDDLKLSTTETIKVDFNGYHNITSEESTPSNYYASGDVIFYYSPYSRAYEKAITVLKGHVNDYRVLNENYAITNQTVYNDGRLVRGLSSKNFTVFNSLFAGNEDTILTIYGNAKIEKPKTFKVLDDGLMPSMFSSETDGYTCGYAVDERFAYFFDESTSTQHAIKLKACTNPSALESLGYAYAKDDTNVYLEAKRIPKAKPKSFQIINRHYSTDGINLFYHQRLVEGADVKSFEILPDIFHSNNSESISSSTWGKDKNSYFCSGILDNERNYQKQSLPIT